MLPEPPESEKPPSAKINISNDDLFHQNRQQKLDEARIQLFKWAIFASITIISFLVIALLATVGIYLCSIYKNQTIPENFWHIPLMIAFMSSTILSVILIQTAKFGALDNKAKDNQETSLAQNIPLLKEFGDFIEKVKK